MAEMKGAFMAILPGADPQKHRCVIETDLADLIIVVVGNMDQAIEEAKKLADDGCGIIELCAGFGHSMLGKVADAVRGKAAVGAVRFDLHAALGKSSDEIFGG